MNTCVLDIDFPAYHRMINRVVSDLRLGSEWDRTYIMPMFLDQLAQHGGQLLYVDVARVIIDFDSVQNFNMWVLRYM